MNAKNIAIVGGGATSVYLLAEFLKRNEHNSALTIYEASDKIGSGMPYSPQWVGSEHMANIACKEIPDLVDRPETWLMNHDDQWLNAHRIKREDISESYIFPRIVLGIYLEDQFNKLVEKAAEKGIKVNVECSQKVADITDVPQQKIIRLTLEGKDKPVEFSHVIIATGHTWPTKREKSVEGYFDSPFPISKLNGQYNHPVCIKGSSLTAVDAIKTLSEHHGHFERKDGKLSYVPNPGTEGFKMVMHSRRGLMPGVRFYFENPVISTHLYISRQAVERHIFLNGGRLSLDYIFEKAFKRVMAEKDPAFYATIKDMNMEQFVAHIEDHKKSDDPFKLFEKDFAESRESLSKGKPIYWKEVLDDFAYTLNFHAKYLSAEDMLRLKQTLMPLVANIVAFLPPDSCEQLIALHEAGKLDLQEVGKESVITTHPNEKGATYEFGDQKVHYDTFIDCTGQKHMAYNRFPFQGLCSVGAVSAAKLKFKSATIAKQMLEEHRPGEPENIMRVGSDYYLSLPGVQINDYFQSVDAKGKANPRIGIVSTPHIAGVNPYYPGLPFCRDASELVMCGILGPQKSESKFMHLAKKTATSSEMAC